MFSFNFSVKLQNYKFKFVKNRKMSETIINVKIK